MNTAVVIGGGPAGLMAAEQLLNAGFSVDLYDAKPSIGRKFLTAGVGGMNITHSEGFADFVSRYGEAAPYLQPMLQAFGADELRAWIHQFGIDTFVGSSGRVFPQGMKAAPLLRLWLARLKQQGLRVHTRHRFISWQDKQLNFAVGEQQLSVPFEVVIFALGGGSWSKLGSDGAWVNSFHQQQVQVNPLKASNCGFIIPWSATLSEKAAGLPVKQVRLSCASFSKKGEFVLTARGIEGSLVYAASRYLRRQIEQQGQAQFHLDLLPDSSADKIRQSLQKAAKKSLSSKLKALKLDNAKLNLLYEVSSIGERQDTERLVTLIKHLPLTTCATTPIDEAISTAGGVCWSQLTPQLMLQQHHGVFCAGEMLDWEAPTGGYLLTACFSTGRIAGLGAVDYLQQGKS